MTFSVNTHKLGCGVSWVGYPLRALPVQTTWAKHTRVCCQNRSITHEMVIEEYLRKSMSSKAIQWAFCCCSIWPFNPQILMEANFSPSRMTSTCSITPPSYPTKVPSSPSTTVMTETDSDNLTYHSSSDMGSNGAKDSSDVGEDDRDEDGDEDGNAHTVNLFVFFPAHTH